MKSSIKIKNLSQGAVVAAVYVVLTYVTAMMGLANGPVQCRFSEALCILPAFMPASVSGLFIGCFLSNILTGAPLPDVIFGSLATLIGAIGTYLFAKKKLNPLFFPVPAIVSNTIIIPFVLKYAYGIDSGLYFFFLTVGAGEIISCGVLGMLLYFYIKKRMNFISK